MTNKPQEPPNGDGPDSPGFRVVDSKLLFAGKKTVTIRHDDESYRLTETRNGKLILQK